MSIRENPIKKFIKENPNATAVAFIAIAIASPAICQQLQTFIETMPSRSPILAPSQTQTSGGAEIGTPQTTMDSQDSRESVRELDPTPSPFPVFSASPVPIQADAPTQTGFSPSITASFLQVMVILALGCALLYVALKLKPRFTTRVSFA